MAITNLNTVLTGLYNNDVLLKSKLVKLSGQLTGSFVANDITIGTANGLTSSGYGLGTTTVDNFGTANKLATEQGAKAYVDAAVADLAGDALTGVATVGAALTSGAIANNIATLTLTTDEKTIGQTTGSLKSLLTLKSVSPSGNYSAIYELQDKDGTRIGDQINIVKDQFLKTAAYDSTTEELVLTFNVPSGELTTRIDVKDMVHEYEGSNAITVGNTVGGKSAVSLKLDAAGEGFLSITNNGLKLDGVQDAIDAVSGAADTRLDVIEAALTDYLSANAVSSAFTAVDGRLDALETKTAAAIASSHIMVGGDGAYADSGKTIGGATLAATPDADTVATEAAVSAAVAAAASAATDGLEALSDALRGYLTENAVSSKFTEIDTKLGTNIGTAGAANQIVVTDASGNLTVTGNEIGGATLAGTTGLVATEAAVSAYVAAETNGFVSGDGLTADKIVLGNGDQTVKTSSKGIITAINNESDDDNVPTAKAVVDFVEAGLDELLTAIQTLSGQIDAL